jgi:hypothetical protein
MKDTGSVCHVVAKSSNRSKVASRSTADHHLSLPHSSRHTGRKSVLNPTSRRSRTFTRSWAVSRTNRPSGYRGRCRFMRVAAVSRNILLRRHQ